MADPVSSTPRKRSRLRTVAIATGLILVAMWFLLTSGDPSVEPTGPPTARTVEAGRDAFRQLRGSRSAQGLATQVRFDARMLDGIAALLSDASGYERISAGIVDGRLSGAASLPVPFSRWLNLSLGITGDRRGFPDLRVTAGHVTLPAWASRAGAEIARWILRWRGAPIPPLDRLVRRVTVEPQSVAALISLPERSGLVGNLIGMQGEAVDGAAVARIYCRLVSMQRRVPTTDLATQVRRAFGVPSAGTADENRAAFVALAFYTVGGIAHDLAPTAVGEARACGEPGGAALLAGRADLAKHWTLSAALSAVLGTDAAGAMGDWKELGDSLPNGSGFSFVDLAADRSGVRIARRATDPASAAQTAKRLARITDEQLLPLNLLAAREGLTEAQFLRRYGSIDAEQYRRTVAWMDRELAGVGVK